MATEKKGNGRNDNRKIGQREKSVTKNKKIGKRQHKINVWNNGNGKWATKNSATGKFGNENWHGRKKGNTKLLPEITKTEKGDWRNDNRKNEQRKNVQPENSATKNDRNAGKVGGIAWLAALPRELSAVLQEPQNFSIFCLRYPGTS